MSLIGARRPDQLQANLAALNVTLTDAQIAKLNKASKPALNFPADINTHLAPMFGFPGTTIDGQTASVSPADGERDSLLSHISVPEHLSVRSTTKWLPSTKLLTEPISRAENQRRSGPA